MESPANPVARARRLLRLCFWAGAIADAGSAVEMLSTRAFRLAYSVPDFSPGSDYRFAMGMGASLMVGWTVLLLWADRAPLQRKGVLVITVVPVILGLVANEVVALRHGFIPLGALAPVWALQVLLSAAFMATYVYARVVETGRH
jgi:hypothetical protein